MSTGGRTNLGVHARSLVPRGPVVASPVPAGATHLQERPSELKGRAKTMRRTVVAGIFLAAAAIAWAATPAPTFRLSLIQGGKTFDSRSEIGRRILVVRFQASWWATCVQESPAFEQAYRKYKQQGVQFLGVQVQDEEADARRFLEAHDATYPAGLDPDLSVTKR